MAAHRGGPWWKLRRKGAGAGVKVAVALLYPVNLVAFRRTWRNIERIPETGPAIVVMNHVSVIDPVIMAAFIWDTGRVPRFMIKSTLFTKPLVGWVFRTAQQIPVDRGSSAARAAVDAAHDALRQGEVVVIYPEGTTTKDPEGWPMQARTGIARMALDNPGVPVIPVGQWGTVPRAAGRKRPAALRRPRLGRRPVSASVGKPVPLEDLRERPLSLDVLREATERIMVAVRDEVAVVRGETPPTEFFKPPKEPKPVTKPTPADPAGGSGAERQ
jgi:1-acyl-sn-glycerol-3-phosphate acyltransferase